jgi:hypothetical protein
MQVRSHFPRGQKRGYARASPLRGPKIAQMSAVSAGWGLYSRRRGIERKEAACVGLLGWVLDHERSVLGRVSEMWPAREM